MDPVDITAGRWHLRAWQPGDEPALVGMCSDPESVRWTTVPTPYDEEHARGFLELTARQWRDGDAATWAVCDSTTGEPLANLALRRQPAAGTWDVGYLTAPHARRRGVMTEALGSACRWAFAELGAERVVWAALLGNDASRRVAEKVGFVVDGTTQVDHRGELMDAWSAVLLPPAGVR